MNHLSSSSDHKIPC
uniref:Uncharacterized protein n=1 Tax=Arundo donax TaxID=35708 RepID=A0A0A9GAB4_ARUDO